MTFVHSFWSKPLLQKKFQGIEKSLKLTLVNYAYSVECIHKHNHKIVLYTDSIGENILKIIPYDEIIVIDNTITQNYHFAASIKFEALQRMTLDQILIDGDIFLQKPKVFDCIENSKADMLVTLFEPRDRIINRHNELAILFNTLKEIDPLYKRPRFIFNDGWYNTSIIKFNNIKMKQEYIEQYIKHVKSCEDLQFNGSVWPDVIFEQYNLTPLSKAKGYTIEQLNPYYIISDKWCLDIGLCHLGAAKVPLHNTYLQFLKNLNYKLVEAIEKHYEYLIKEYGNYK